MFYWCVLLSCAVLSSNETLHELAAYLNLVPKRQQSMEMESDEEEISTALLVELLVRPRLSTFVESTVS